MFISLFLATLIFLAFGMITAVMFPINVIFALWLAGWFLYHQGRQRGREDNEEQLEDLESSISSLKDEISELRK